MPSRQEYEDIAAAIIQPYLSSPTDAWKGIYRLLLWYEQGVPHIVETSSLGKRAWRDRARRIELELANAYGCAPHEVLYKVDALMQHKLLRRLQRQNPLGMGFTVSLVILLRHFSNPQYKFLTEEEIGSRVFADIQDPPRRASDIVIVEGLQETAIISAKWSIRHDRLKDWLNECAFYKEHRTSLKFYVATNEFMSARLRLVADDACIDGVFHVNRELLLLANQQNGRLDPIKDLTALLAHFQ